MENFSVPKNFVPGILASKGHYHVNQSVSRNGALKPHKNHITSSAMKDGLVVSVQNICKSYVKGKPTLNSLCMNVKRGTIYGLLGSSGCGKTTLLSCIVGLKKWDSGEVRLFGRKCNGTPGRRVGFMPQEVALHSPLSVIEVMNYFGRLYGMRKDEIEKQWHWLNKLLQLPSKFKLIKNLSGGQKRRVSLAVSLVHSPDLLILDEPTVGIDPLLRQSIWQHFQNMVDERKITVIVTTHYIEETRASDTIGVMRNGRLLVENSPDFLLQQHGCYLLEEVVLKLCHADENGLKNGLTTEANTENKLNNSYSNNQKIVNYSGGIEDDEILGYEHKQKNIESSVTDRVLALTSVILRTFSRQETFIMMLLFLPSLLTVLNMAVLGAHPKDLQLGVINHEFNGNEDECLSFYEKFTRNNALVKRNTSCQLEFLSCRLISELNKTSSITTVNMKSEKIALERVRVGKLLGYFSIPANYSQNVADLAAERRFAENGTLKGSRVGMHLDMSNAISSDFVFRDAHEAYERFAMDVARDCGFNPEELVVPMKYREPVFGHEGATLYEYFMPVIILSTIFLFPMLMTSLLFINDRKEGTLDRARVAGVHFKEIMISHALTQGSVIVVQTLICGAVLYFYYGVRVKGSYLLCFCLCILGGFSGQTLGLIMGVIFQEEVEAFMIGMFMTMVLFFLEGAFWPIQGMLYYGVRYASYSLPTTLLIEAIRSVLYRGVGLFSNFVWPGVVITGGWTLVFQIVSMILFIRQQKYS